MPLTLTGETGCVEESALADAIAAVPGLDRVDVRVDVATLESEVQVEWSLSWRDRSWVDRVSRPMVDCGALPTAIAQSAERATRDWPPLAHASQRSSAAVALRLPVEPLPAAALGQVQVDHRWGTTAWVPVLSARWVGGVALTTPPPRAGLCNPASACDDPRRVWTQELAAGVSAHHGRAWAVEAGVFGGVAWLGGSGFPDDRGALAPVLDATVAVRRSLTPAVAGFVAVSATPVRWTAQIANGAGPEALPVVRLAAGAAFGEP